MKIVVDSNVLIAAGNLNDARHAECELLRLKLIENEIEVVQPATALWEVHAYTAHPEKRKSHAQNRDLHLKVQHYDVTGSLYQRTHNTALTPVKALDRIFVAVAKDQNLVLVTNDTAMLKYADELGARAVSVATFLNTHWPDASASSQ